MASMSAWLEQVVTPPVLADDSDSSQAWMQYWMIVTISLASVVVNSVRIFLLPEGATRWVVLIVGIAVLSLGVLTLIQRRRLRASAWLQIAAVWLMLSAAAWTAGGVEAPSIAAQLLVVAVVIMLLGVRAGFAAAILAGAAVALLAYAQAAGFLPRSLVSHTPVSRAFVLISYLFTLAILMGLLMTVLQRARESVSRELEERAAAEARLHAVIDSAPFGAHAYDLTPSGDLILVDANATAAVILARDHEPLLGLRIEDAFPSDAANGVADGFRRVAREGGVFEVDAVEYDDGLRRGVVEIRAIRLGTDRVASFFRDVTRERAANIALEKLVAARTTELQATAGRLALANRELVEAGRIKDDFLASMSHELRTPLNSVIGFSDMLGAGMAGPLNEEQSKQVGMISASGRHLLVLVDEVLDLSRIERGVLDIEFEDVELVQAVDQSLRMVAPMADAKGIILEHEHSDDRVVIFSDAGRLQQVLINLLTNAIKFTDSGRVTVKLTADLHKVRLHVADTGIGIPEEDLPRIFERFYQVRPSGGGKNEGAGLGLSLVERLVEALGGEISVDSEVGVGTTVAIELPAGALTAPGA